jgi:hypothetical protein
MKEESLYLCMQHFGSVIVLWNTWKNTCSCLVINCSYCVNIWVKAVHLSRNKNTNFLFNVCLILAIYYTEYIHFFPFKNFPFSTSVWQIVCFQIPFTTIPLKLDVPLVRNVASGLRHSAILTADGVVMVCGNGKNGQLGLTDNNGMPVVEVEQPQEGI